MIGLQDLLIKQNISVTKLAKELGMPPGRIWDWFKVNRIPEKYLSTLAEKFNIEEEYFGKQVNDISTYRPRKRGFNDYEIRGDITVIFMPKRDGRILETIIDTKNLERIKNLGLGWSAAWIKSVNKYYAKASEYIGNGQPNITHYLHIEIMQVSADEYVVDHKNNDRLDNREENLRATKQVLNTKNRTTKNKNNKSGYRNVSKRGKWWIVQLQIEGKNTTLKKFPLDQLEEAGVYAEKMREKYYGEFAGND